jgi:hypothetical protein
MPSSDLIYTCGHGKFAKLTLLNYTQRAANVTAVLITENVLEIIEGHGDVPVVNQWATVVDYCH